MAHEFKSGDRVEITNGYCVGRRAWVVELRGLGRRSGLYYADGDCLIQIDGENTHQWASSYALRPLNELDRFAEQI